MPFLVGSPGKALRRNPGNAPELMHWCGFFPGRAALTRATGWCGLVFCSPGKALRRNPGNAPGLMHW
ncbi:hypothetical protein, partial [Klebsiella michiganensis]|uniref:hypothetical protein n=4 Tax=Klebsiella michiganensis TaxID=1134687 RepID=UPI0025965802